MSTLLETQPDKSADVQPIVFGLADSARLLCVSEISIHRLLRAGKLRRVAGLRKILIPRTELERFASNFF